MPAGELRGEVAGQPVGDLRHVGRSVCRMADLMSSLMCARRTASSGPDSPLARRVEGGEAGRVGKPLEDGIERAAGDEVGTICPCTSARTRGGHPG